MGASLTRQWVCPFRLRQLQKSEMNLHYEGHEDQSVNATLGNSVTRKCNV